MPSANTGYTSCGFQSNLQIPISLARAVTVDSEVVTNSRTLHTLNVGCNVKINMRYNVYIETKSATFNIMDIDQDQIILIVDAYKLGKRSFTIAGSKYIIDNLNSLKFYTFEKDIRIDNFKTQCSQRGLLGGFYKFTYFPPETLELIGSDVTDKFLENFEFGELEKVSDLKTSFIHKDRIDSLKKISNSKFDLSRLIRFCEEMNSNYQLGNYLSVAMIGRSILNHVPPLFGFQTFNEVANNYGNASFKKNMQHLNVTLRNIADSYLHDTIRIKESLPNEIQVNFSQDLDSLLAEIIRKL